MADKMVRYSDRTDVMSCCKKSCRQIGLVEYYILSMVVCGVCVTGPDTINKSEDYLGVRKEEPALQCRRQIYAPDTLSLKPGSGATEGVLD